MSAYFPSSSSRAPEFHILNSQWTVGKAIDTLAARAGIRNDNNVPGATKLYLYSQSGLRLSNSNTLEGCVIEGSLSGGGVVILEYGEQLGAGHDSTMFTDASKSDKDCCIM